MAQALGVRLLDHNQQELPQGGGALIDLATIDMSHFDSRLKEVEILIASDVTNPLCGPKGASYVFSTQKGATIQMVEQLDKALSHYAKIIKKDLGKSIENEKGAGAAGGLGAGLLAFTHSQMKLGIDIVTETIQLEEKIKTADIVFTGEGGMDFQTKFGKAPYGVSKIAKKYNKPCFALAGFIGDGIEVLYEEGMTAIFGIQSKAQNLSEALQDGEINVERTTENIARLLRGVQ